MRRRITLVSTDAGPGHCCGLAIGLQKYGQLTTVYANRNPHGLDFIYPAKYGYKNIPKRGDDLIIVSCLCYDQLKKSGILDKLVYTNRRIIITDGRFARDPDYYNSRFANYDVITTACKRHFRKDLPTKTYYQPFDLSGFRLNKNKELTIGHSPFKKIKFREKGTEKIKHIVESYRVDLDIITNVPWKECLERKAKCHIFIDQIDHYDRDKFKFHDPDYRWPALGKSGIEALHLGCLVITYGAKYDTEIPAPPVVWIKDEKDFKEKLEYYLLRIDERKEIGELSQEWALKYASYDYAAKHVLGLK